MQASMKWYRSICGFFLWYAQELNIIYLHISTAVKFMLHLFSASVPVIFFFLDSHIISVSLLVDAFLCGILSWFQQSGDLRHFLLFLGVPYYSFWVTWKISNTRQKNEGSHGADMTSFWLKEIYGFQTPYIFICLRKMV